MEDSRYVTDKELINRFGFHPATDKTKTLHEEVRSNFLEIVLELNDILPEGREKSLAFTALQEAAMWANASVACTLAPLDETSVDIYRPLTMRDRLEVMNVLSAVDGLIDVVQSCARNQWEPKTGNAITAAKMAGLTDDLLPEYDPQEMEPSDTQRQNSPLAAEE